MKMVNVNRLHHEGGKIAALRTTPQEIFLVLISVRG
jgi:hypothetical protein